MGSYTAIIKGDGDWWIGWVEEVSGVNAQERSREELLASHRLALGEALEFNRKEAREAPETDFEEETYRYEATRVAAAPQQPRLRPASRGWQSLLVAKSA